MRDRVVVGALVADSLRVDAPPGVIRAFDARTGAVVWAWDPVPPGWKPRASADGRVYEAGTPNVWSILSADEERGLVFLPMGNASPDSFAAVRNGLDFYASSTVALDARDGHVVWAFQTVHHDVWDYDVPAQPALFQIPNVGGGRPGVAQITKMGHLFLLDRETGLPLYPVEERPVPQSDVPGEKLSPTQPFPTHPPPLHPAFLKPDDAWGFTPIDRRYCAKELAEHRNEGLFTPPSLGGSVQFPGSAGGPNWGGVAIDPKSGVLYVNQMHAGAIVTLVPRAEYDADTSPAGYPKERYPMRGAPYGVSREAAALEFRRALQSAAVGHLDGRRSRIGPGALALHARNHPRPSAVAALALARCAESRRQPRHRRRPSLHRRHHRQVLPCIRYQDR